MYSIGATNTALNTVLFTDEDLLFELFSDSQPMVLATETELQLLFNLIDRTLPSPILLEKSSSIDLYYDLTTIQLPEFTQNEFDEFYSLWLEKSGRENDMSEYGALLFLHGMSRIWNAKKHRIIVKEKVNTDSDQY